MHKLVKHMMAWGSRKAVLPFVLFFLLVLPAVSVYRIAMQNNRLQATDTALAENIVPDDYSNEAWALSGSGIAILLIASVICILLWEIHIHRRINDELKIQKEHFRITINGITEGLITTGKNGEILYMNPAAEKLTGWKNEEVKNLPLEKVYDVVNEKTGKPFDHVVKRVLKAGHAVEFENNTLLQTKNNDQLIICNCGSPLFDKKGNITGSVLLFNDITERKKAEEKTLSAIERYDMLAQATSDTIWDWDITNNKMQYNAAMNDMFGYSLSQVDNVPGWWKQNLHPEDVKKVTESLLGIFENEKQTFQLEYRFRCADGSYKYIFDRAFVMYDAKQRPVRVIGAMQDVSYEREEEKRITKAILDAQEKERHQIGLELHDNVNQILVGTLLNLGMISKVPADKAPELIEKSREYIIEAIGEIRKLSHRLAPANFDNISLHEIFESLIKSVNVQNAFEYTIVFEGFDEQTVSNDIQVNLLRVLQEQLNNIVKYASASFIEISVINRGHQISMRIFDNGVGFNPSSVKRGIGLGNIKKRAESLKGKFLLNSTVGNGCEIMIEIPLDAAA
jgi:PAS domain S-box-containing protein